MARVFFEHVTKRFGDVRALDDFHLEIPDKEFLVLVGPSGCGKSTALRLLAGLERLSEGSIYIGDRRVNDVAAKDRDIAMVFQSYALYPHMTVYDNIAFGLRLRKTPRQEIDRRVSDAARMLEVENLLDRKPGQLSGGQRQRVAVARAIVREPRVFLLDEPLSNLDAKLRVHTRAQISKLHDRLQTTFVYVTHDQVEAMTMATRIAVMNLGVIQQVGSPQELYDNPANMFVAGFIGSPAMNFFESTLAEEDGRLRLKGEGFALDVPVDRADEIRKLAGEQLVFGVRPDNVHDSHFVPSGIEPITTPARVDVVEPLGNEVLVHLLVGDAPILARVDPRTSLKAGESAEVVIDMERMHVFDKDTERSLGTAARPKEA